MALARHHVEALEEYLRGQLTADEVTISGVQRLTGGAIQDNLGLELEIHHPQDSTLAGHQRWVLRSNAPTQLAMSLSRAQEYAVLQAAHGAGVKVPRPLGYCADAAVIGRPFYLMERLPGTARGAAVVAMGSEELAAELGAQLARLHRITPGSPGTAGLDFLPLPAGDPAAARLAAYRQYLDALPHPHPVLEYSLAWLERHLPRGGEVALCHVDYRTGNYLVDNGQLQGILDWEFAAWSQPLEDLGWFCAPCWRFGRRDLAAGGVGSRGAFYRGYSQASGLAVDATQVPYWEVMALIRWAIIALQQGERFRAGEPSLELLLTGTMAVELEAELLRAMAELGP